MSKVLLYGANGYTAGLLLEKMLLTGLKPVLAGRSQEKVAKIAKKYGLEYLCFDLDQPPVKKLKKFELFFNAAGPFSKTIRPALELCILSGMHYLDITGEIEVFEYTASQSERLAEAGIMAVPGVGFDVVPTDVMACYLSEQLTDATHLSLAFVSSGTLSRGTAKTMIENLGKGSAIRRDGKIKSVDNLDCQRKVPFGTRQIECVGIPWGDVSTAFYSTGIENITVYMPMNGLMKSGMKVMDKLSPLLARKNFIRIAQKVVGALIFGPDEEKREKSKTKVWGEVRNAQGQTLQATLEVKDGYEFTAISSLTAIEYVLDSNNKKVGGFFTPTLAFGTQFLKEELNLDPKLIRSKEL